MKKYILLLWIGLTIPAFAKNFIPYQLSYELISDEFDPKIPTGKFFVEGTIYNYSVRGEGIDNRLPGVRVIAGKKITVSDSKGYFRITPKLQDSLLTFVKGSFNDSYLENIAFKEKHHIVVRIFMKLANEENQFMVKKPVIYCYSDQDTIFDFQVISKGELTFAYPPLNSNYTWQMKLENNVLSDQKSLQNYPYLFWESQQKDIRFLNASTQQSKNEVLGSIVAKANIVSFLDSTLTALGFNYTEKTDFITFWAPQMQTENYYVIQFVQNRMCDKFASYHINPAPDHINRIYMLFAGNITDTFPFKVVPQALKPLDRTGFYFVDWGGIAIQLANYYITEKTN